MIDIEKLRTMIREIVREELATMKPQAVDNLPTRLAAEEFHLTQDTIRRWIRQGKLVPVGTGRTLRVRRADLERLIRAPKATPGREPSVEAMADKIMRKRFG